MEVKNKELIFASVTKQKHLNMIKKLFLALILTFTVVACTTEEQTVTNENVQKSYVDPLVGHQFNVVVVDDYNVPQGTVKITIKCKELKEDHGLSEIYTAQGVDETGQWYQVTIQVDYSLTGDKVTYATSTAVAISAPTLNDCL